MKFSTTVVMAAAVALSPLVTAGRFSDFNKRRQDRVDDFLEQNSARDTDTTTTDYRFLNDQSEAYKVDSLPDVPFDVGELYAGLVPIADDPDQALFFLFAPTTGDPVDEVVIWLNGGPGCSSSDGFLQENGPFTWQPGTYQPVQNPYTWVNLTNMLWVDQPISTGYSVGTSNATTQTQTAAQFVSWFKNWQDVFGIKNYKIYVTGESYAGRYVPYISAAMLDEDDKTYYDLSGAITYDPCIGSFEYTQEEAVAVPYVLANNNILGLNSSFVAQMVELHESCGYKDYVDTYLTFPPAGVQPPKYFNYSSETDLACDVFDIIDDALLDVNPCFDIYETVQQCPLLWDVLGFPTQLTYSPTGAPTIYFNRSDVKEALHVPTSTSWSLCNGDPYPYSGGPESEGDLSPDPIQGVLPQVIEATNRVLVGNGDYDMIIITNGTLLSIQNMTWNGALGFQHRPRTPLDVSVPDLAWTEVYDENGDEGGDGPEGTVGIKHYERGLMWVETYQSGHMEPEFQPRASWRHISWVLGRTDDL